MHRSQIPVGPRGLALLAATGLAGIVLAVHGWSSSGASASLSPVSVSSRPSPTHTGASPSGRPSAGSSAAATSGPSAAQGPLLSSEPYASYAFLIWPGTPNSAARAALTGLSVSVKRLPGGISVKAEVNGQAAGPAHTYADGSKVYVVEASMGDESGNTDYNLGDDGLVVTNAAGRIIQ